VQRFRGGLLFKAHRLVHNSTPGSRVMKKKKKKKRRFDPSVRGAKAASGSPLVEATRSTNGKPNMLADQTVQLLHIGGFMLTDADNGDRRRVVRRSCSALPPLTPSAARLRSSLFHPRPLSFSLLHFICSPSLSNTHTLTLSLSHTQRLYLPLS